MNHSISGRRHLIVALFLLIFSPAVLANSADVTTLPVETAVKSRVPLPPVEDSFKSRNRIAVLSVEQVLSESSLVVRPVTSLWGDVPAESFKLNLPEWDPVTVTAESTYIMVYSSVMRHRFYRDQFEENPDGPLVARLPYSGVAVVEDSEQARTVFREFQKSISKDDTAEINNRITLILEWADHAREHDQAGALRLALIELSKHHKWMASATDAQYQRYRKLVEARAFGDELDEHLISAISLHPESRWQPWLAVHCRKVVGEAGPIYELTSMRPLLVRSCLRHIEQLGSAEDAGLLGPLLSSNAPGVAKAAVDALMALAPDRLPLLAENALESKDPLNSEVRRILSNLVE